jgi:hypothetical protein
MAESNLGCVNECGAVGPGMIGKFETADNLFENFSPMEILILSSFDNPFIASSSLVRVSDLDKFELKIDLNPAEYRLFDYLKKAKFMVTKSLILQCVFDMIRGLDFLITGNISHGCIKNCSFVMVNGTTVLSGFGDSKYGKNRIDVENLNSVIAKIVTYSGKIEAWTQEEEEQITALMSLLSQSETTDLKSVFDLDLFKIHNVEKQVFKYKKQELPADINLKPLRTMLREMIAEYKNKGSEISYFTVRQFFWFIELITRTYTLNSEYMDKNIDELKLACEWIIFKLTNDATKFVDVLSLVVSAKKLDTQTTKEKVAKLILQITETTCGILHLPMYYDFYPTSTYLAYLYPLIYFSNPQYENTKPTISAAKASKIENETYSHSYFVEFLENVIIPKKKLIETFYDVKIGVELGDAWVP